MDKLQKAKEISEQVAKILEREAKSDKNLVRENPVTKTEEKELSSKNEKE